MTAADVLHALEQAGCTVVLDGNTIRVRGQLTDDLRAAIRENKPELVALLREQARPQFADNVFCFDCFRRYGKKARYQPHRVAVWEEDASWLELTCTSCGAKCYMRDRWGGSAEGNKAGEQ